MQCVAKNSTRAAVARPTRSARVAVVRVAAKASSPQDFAKKIALVASTLPAAMVAHPAFALVDERMNGDGTGLPFGINNGALGLAMIGVFGLIWSQWYAAQKDLGDFEDKDDGLKID
ncbi:hypothetical protein FOA52_007948 [Chlamydomonas sp. UWO 241]|nr:hypothetical protein FOA52_007948 [Chlamydomonas sp. UWO 241]